MHFVYIVTYFGQVLVIEQEINSLMNVYYIRQKNVIDSIDNETIIQRFQNMKTRRRKF